MKKTLCLVALLCCVFCSYGQLSNVHYLPPLKQGGNNQAIRQQAFYLSTPETASFSVNVYQGTNPAPVATITNLSNATPRKYDVSDGDNNITLVTNTNTGIVLSNSGLRFESVGGERFYVNYRGRSNSQATSLTSKGRQSLGTLFKWGGRPNFGNSHNSLNATLGIMATVDNTVVNIYDYGTDCEFRLQGDNDGITANTLTINLNAGQTYVLEAWRNATVANIDCWLGATIQSNRLIAISNGNLNGSPRTGTNSRDAVIDQPVPENVLGREYVFIRGNGVNDIETPIIIGTQNGTDIFIGGVLETTINTGDYYVIDGSNYSSTSAGGNMYVTTSKETYAYQHLSGSGSIFTGGLNFIAPVNCLLPNSFSNISDIRDVDGRDFNGGVTIVASATTPDANITVTDGTGTVTLPSSVPVNGTSDWKTFYVPGLIGNVSVSSSGPIAVGFLGVNSAAGIAGYFSGFDTVPVVELDITGGGCLPGADVFEISNNFDAYQWFENGAMVPGATTNVYTPMGPGFFFVRVTRGACTYDSAVLPAYNCMPEIVLSKVVDNSTVLEGDTVTFTVTVEQLGVDPVSNLVIEETLPPELTLVSATPSAGSWTSPNWTIGDMFSGEVHTLTVVATVNEVAMGTTVTNLVNNTQDQVDVNSIPDDPTEDVTIINSEIEVTKADRAPTDGSFDTVGEMITYDFVVTNTGDTPLMNITIVDPNIDTGSLTPASVANLAIGASASFTATHTITQADIEADQVVNTATGRATLSNGFVISDQSDDPDDPTTTTDDPTITPIDQKGALVLEKIAQPAADGLYDAAMEVITYELTVYNTGNVSLNNVTITDPNVDMGSISPASVANLPVGSSAVFTATYTILQADIDASPTVITNSAMVTGTEVVEGTVIMDTSDDPTTLAPDDATMVGIPQFGQLSVTKAASPPADGAYDTVGEVITYTIIATSVGNVTLTDVNVVDPNADTITLQSTTGTDDGLDEVVNSMAPMDTATFIATHIITQEDLDAGQVVNTATVGSVAPDGGSITDLSDDPNDPTTTTDDPTVVSMTFTPSYTLTKVADDDSNVVEGQLITYTYTVTNTGNVTFDNVSLSDMHSGSGTLGTITLQSTTGTDDGLDQTINELDPGATGTWTAEYTVTATDITNQTAITNTATAMGTPRTGTFGNPTANESVTVVPVETICGNDTLAHDLTGDVDASIVSFSWVAADNNLVSGESTSTQTTTEITDTLVNDTSTNQEVVYTITGFDGGGIAQETYTYTVTVLPAPRVTSDPTQSICTGTRINRNLIGNVDNFFENVNFSWSAADNPNVTGETTTVSTDDRIRDTLVNTSTSPQDVVYTITPTASLTSCVGNTYTITVTVNPEPTGTNATDRVCSDVALNHDLDGDVDLTGNTFSWSAAANANVSGETTSTSTATSITDVLTNISGSVQTVIYTITPTSADGCVGDSYTYTVTVDPEPDNATAPTDTVCSDVALNHDLTGDVNLTGNTFSWSAASNANVSGETTSTSTATSITDVLTNISGSAQTVVYTITPTSSDGCAGDSYTYTVTVDPEPDNATAPTDTVCSDVALNHDLNGDVNVTGSSFSWSAAANANVSGETTSTSTATSITDVLTNVSGSAQTVVYTITPTSPDGCTGDSYTYTVMVDPEPNNATAPTDTVCSDVALNHDLAGDVDLTGNTFSWSAAANANVSGETTSTSTATSITDVLTNISGSVQTVVYTITPTSSDGCVGDSYTYTVTVDPEPNNATAPTDTVCSDVALNHDLTGDVNLTGNTFSWSAAANANVSGETTSTSTATSITDVLTNISGSVQTVIYTITPTSSDGCAGDSYTYTVTVDPEPDNATAPTDTVCSDVALNHDLNGDVNVTGSSFSWSAAANGNVSGETTSTSTTTSITDVLTNASGSAQTVVYTITPTSPDGCTGDSYTYTVTVDPEPDNATAPTDTVCSDVALNHDLNGDVDLTGNTFSWSAAANANVSGETTSTSTATSITDVLTNISGSVQTVIYTITPTSADGCVGDSYTYTVTVDPEPDNMTAPTDTVCSDVALNHDLTGDVNLTGSTFSWSAAANANVSGETTSTSTATSITDVLTNISGSVQTVVYTITPTSSDGCAGDSYTYTVTVDPEPDNMTAPTDTVCSDVALNHDLNGDVNVTGSTFSWSAASNANVSGETTSTSTATSITDVLTNVSGSAQTVVYTITPTSPDGCTGDSYTYTVTVDPEPNNATAPTDTVCSDVALNHDLAGDVNLTGSTFSWSAAANANVSGETTSTSTATSITDVLTNISGSVQTVVYTITPTSSDGCAGDSYTYTVTVDPEPDNMTAPTDTVCSDVALSHDLNGDVNVTGSSFSWSAASNANVSGETTSTSTATSITDVLTNASGSAQTVVYTITPTSPDGCTGDSYTYTVTVDPEPDNATAPTDTVCSDVALSHDLNGDVNVTGSSFSWSAASNANVGGETTVTSTATSITDVLINTTNVEQTVVYTITPTSADGCVGDAFTYTVTVSPRPELRVTKVALPASDGAYDTVGERVTYRIEVENLKEVQMNMVNVSDLNADAGSILPALTSIPPFGMVTFTATHEITQIDLDAGEIINSATATGFDPCGTMVSDVSDDPNTTAPNDATITPLVQIPEIRLVKQGRILSDTTIPRAGDQIEYTFTVTNTGNVTLQNITIDDALTGTTSLPISPSNLAPGTDGIATVRYTITQSDLNTGVVVNSATATGQDPMGNPIMDVSDSGDESVDADGDGDSGNDMTLVSLPQDPNLALTKSGVYVDTNDDGIPNAGDEMHYTFTVTNTGNIDLTAITVSDGLSGVVLSGTTIDLRVGETDTSTFTAIYALQEQDLFEGRVVNQALVTGILPDGSLVNDLSDDPTDTTDVDIDDDGDAEDKTITFIPFPDDLVIYTGMSPNGDGINDQFRIVGLQNFPNNTLRIYNRWGVLVFEQSAYEQPGSSYFEGISSGRATVQEDKLLPVGTYYYVLTYENDTGVRRTLGGFVYVNR